MFFKICFCGGYILLTPTIENITFLSSAIVLVLFAFVSFCAVVAVHFPLDDVVQLPLD